MKVVIFFVDSCQTPFVIICKLQQCDRLMWAQSLSTISVEFHSHFPVSFSISVVSLSVSVTDRNTLGMPPKKRNRRLFNSPPPTTGKAAIHLNEHYSSLPLDLKDIKKGHIFHSLIGNGRHVGSVQKILKSKTILGDFESSLYYSISKALVSLGKYRKLTDQVEF